MPALQVRDFPQDLYDELRLISSAHHRSMAQQTVAAVDQMIHGPKEACPAPSASLEARTNKRNGIFERARQRRMKRDTSIPLPGEMLDLARKERDEALDRFAQEFLEGRA